MKKYFVAKVYKGYVPGATIVFTTDSNEDANLYANLMTRNGEEDYTYHVGCFCK